MLRLLLISSFVVGLFAQGGPAGHVTVVKTLPTKCSPKSGDIVYLINSLGTTGTLYLCTAPNTFTVTGTGGSTPPALVSFNTATNTCSIISGTVSACTASSTSGTGSKPGLVVTDNFGQVVKWGSCYSGGTPSGIFGGLTYGNAIQDVTITSSNNVTTFTFSVDSSGYCGVSTGGMGPQGATGQGVPTGGTTGQTLIKNSNTNYDTTWANAPTGPAQTGVNKVMGLHANGLGGTAWEVPNWPGTGLGLGRLDFRWSATGNGIYPNASNLSCEITAGTGANCTGSYDSTNFRWYRQAQVLSTGSGFGAFEYPYGTAPTSAKGSNFAMGSKFRYYNATAVSGTFMAWGIGVEDTAGTAKSSTGGASGATGAIIGIRYHTNTDYTDPAWMCVYGANHGGGSITEVSSGVAIDTAWHTFEVVILDVSTGSPDIQYFIDGNRVCQAGISGATYTVSTFLSAVASGTLGLPYYVFSSVYNYAAVTGNEADWKWTAITQDVK